MWLLSAAGPPDSRRPFDRGRGRSIDRLDCPAMLPYADNRNHGPCLADRSEWLTGQSIWQRCEQQAAPLRVMRLVDDTGRLFARARKPDFDCGEIGLDAFGYNIENRYLVAAMDARAARAVDDDNASAMWLPVSSPGDGRGQDHPVWAEQGSPRKLCVGADGRHGRCRDAAGIAIDQRASSANGIDLQYQPIPVRIGNISTEFHTGEGPLRAGAVTGRTDRAVVWVTTPVRAEQLTPLNDDDLATSDRAAKSFHSGPNCAGGRTGRCFSACPSTGPGGSLRTELHWWAKRPTFSPPIGAQGLKSGAARRCCHRNRHRPGSRAWRGLGRYSDTPGL